MGTDGYSIKPPVEGTVLCLYTALAWSPAHNGANRKVVGQQRHPGDQRAMVNHGLANESKSLKIPKRSRSNYWTSMISIYIYHLSQDVLSLSACLAPVCPFLVRARNAWSIWGPSNRCSLIHQESKYPASGRLHTRCPSASIRYESCKPSPLLL